MKKSSVIVRLFLSLIVVIFITPGCSGVKGHGYLSSGHHYPAIPHKTIEEYTLPLSLDVSAIQPLEKVFPNLDKQRVIYVGETHDRYDHHLNQLEVVKYLYKKNGNIAIGVEFFQRPFQEVLDNYIAGEIDEAVMLKKTEYYSRWRFDYRLYRPIFKYARDNKIPIIALDVSTELRIKVGRNGLDSLTSDEKTKLPEEMDMENSDYKAFIQHAFSSYHKLADEKFNSFLQAQIVRDETMAETASKFLKAKPKSQMVILAGTGHVISGLGIPSRLKRRLDVKQTIILNDLGQKIESGVGDYILFPEPIALPETGKLGIAMQDEEVNGGVKVASVKEYSAADKAGMEQGDRILKINSVTVDDTSDVKIIMLDRKKAESIDVAIEREGFFGAKRLLLTVELD